MKNESENMEARILEAAGELFMEQGFVKTTMGRIAQRAGCNQALVHYYYRTKERLFEQVFEQKIRYIAGHILAIDEGEGTFEQKIARMAGAHFDFLVGNQQFVPFFVGEMLSSPERFTSVLDKLGHYPKGVFARLDAELTREVERGTIRRISTFDLVATVMSLNIAPFLMLPAVSHVTTLPDGAVEEWLAARRDEIIETVLSRIRL